MLLPETMTGHKLTAVRVLAWTLVLAATGGAFTMYAQPEFMVQLSNQMWACF
jgi:hypothetical protein